MPPQEELIQLKNHVKELEAEVKTLRQSVDYLTKKLYGRSSEKTEVIMPSQLSLFNEAEANEDSKAKEPTLQNVLDYRRKKYPGQREALLKDLPHEKRLCTLPDDDRQCLTCGSELIAVGQEFVRTEIEFIPAKVRVIDVYRETFECRNCRKNELPYMDKAPVPDPVLQHSMASASSIAWVMYQKFVNALPLYRQEQDWKNLGLDLSRATMANWITASARDWLQPIAALLQKELVKQKYLHADETTVQVLKEAGRKNTSTSYMWVYSTGENSQKPIRLFEYQPGRSGCYPKEFLKGFKGYLHTDGYAGYEQVEDIQRCYCWAHVRRKFVDALPKDVNSADTTIPAEGIRRCNELFDIEKSLWLLSPEKRQKERLRQEKPVLDALWLWLDTVSSSIPYKGKLADAVNYAKNHKDGLLTYLEDGNCVISNNMAENSIRPFTVGRKNWLFCGIPKGASASATVYSLIETAKANHLNPYKYLLHLLRDMPGEDFLRHPEFLEDHLPWNPQIQLMCK